MLGDLRILDTGDELLLDTERVALQALFNMIRRFSIGYDVELHKRTLERGLLSLIGPEAALVAGAGALGAAEHAHAVVEVGGTCRPARSGPTWVSTCCATPSRCRRRCAPRSSDAGAPAVSEAAAECLRIEHGRPRYGIDLDDTVIPQEAGLNERAVSFTKGCYVGQETVARLYYRGKPNRQLRGLRLSGPASTGDELRLRGTAGRAARRASRCRRGFGPIGLALVRREAPPGSRVAVGDGGDVAARGRRAAVRRLRPTGRRTRSSAVAVGRRVERELRRLAGARRGRWRRSAARRSRPAARARRARRRVRPRVSAASRPLGRALAVSSGSGAPVDEPAADQPERVVPPGVDRMRGEQQPRARVGRLEHAAEPLEDRPEPAQPPAQPRGALVALLGRAARIWRLDVAEQPRPPVAPSTNSRSASSRRRRYRFGSRSPRQGDRQRPICP